MFAVVYLGTIVAVWFLIFISNSYFQISFLDLALVVHADEQGCLLIRTISIYQWFFSAWPFFWYKFQNIHILVKNYGSSKLNVCILKWKKALFWKYLKRPTCFQVLVIHCLLFWSTYSSTLDIFTSWNTRNMRKDHAYHWYVTNWINDSSNINDMKFT